MSRRQWLLVLLAVLVPLLLNVVATYLEVKPDLLIPAITEGSYQMRDLQVARDPWPAIIEGTLPILLALLGLAWFVVFISMRAFFRRFRSVVRFGLAATLALLTAAVFTVGTVEMSYVRYWTFYAYSFATGIHRSRIVAVWSPPWVFVGIALIMWCAMSVSQERREPAEEASA